MRQGNGSGLVGIVAELTSLRSLSDTAHRREVDDVSRLGVSPDSLGSRKQGKESESGKVVRGRVDLVAVDPSFKGFILEHVLGEPFRGLLAFVDVGTREGDTVVYISAPIRGKG